MICALIMRDLPFSEIAKELGISERAVEGRMRLLRQRVNRMIEQGEIDHHKRTLPAVKSSWAATDTGRAGGG